MKIHVPKFPNIINWQHHSRWFQYYSNEIPINLFVKTLHYNLCEKRSNLLGFPKLLLKFTHWSNQRNRIWNPTWPKFSNVNMPTHFFLKCRSTEPHSQEFRSAWSPEIYISANSSSDSEQEACGPLVEISSCASQPCYYCTQDTPPIHPRADVKEGTEVLL